MSQAIHSAVALMLFLPLALFSAACANTTAPVGDDGTSAARLAVEQTSATEARFRTDAYLSLRAHPYPPGDFYDRPYWNVELVCNAFRSETVVRDRDRRPPQSGDGSWTHGLGMAPAGSERGEPFLHKTAGPCEADVCIDEQNIALYLYWKDKSLILSHAGGAKAHSAGRAAFDAAVREMNGETMRLAVEFLPSPKITSTHSGFTSGSSLITGVPGNLSTRAASTRPADEE